jgi:hypothetical protein
LRHRTDWASPTETSPLAAESDKFLVMAVITANTQEAMFQASTLQIIIELTNHVAR